MNAIKELDDMMDRYIDGVLNGGDVVKLLNVYVQINSFANEHAKCSYFISLI